MRIESLETSTPTAAGAPDFVKITTDDGLVGWSEYNETFGGAGLTTLIERLAPTLIGKDPRAHEAHVALTAALRRTSAGGVVQQAIGAIENASSTSRRGRSASRSTSSWAGRSGTGSASTGHTAARTGSAGGRSSGSRRCGRWTTWCASGGRS